MAGISALTVESPTQSHEHQAIAPDNEIRWQHWTNRALFDAQGKAVAYQSIGEDITERRRIEESLQFTKFAINHASDAIFCMGPDARFIYVNEAACQWLGYTQEELLTLSVCDIGPDWPPETWQDHWRELKEHGLLAFETRHQRKDGSIFPVEITENFLTFGGKEFNCAIVRDITERERARKILQESETRFRTIFDNAVDGILVADPEAKKYRDANRAACRMLGYSLEEIRNLGVEDIHPLEDLPYA